MAKKSKVSGASVSSVSSSAPVTGDATADASTAESNATAETSGAETSDATTAPTFDRSSVLAAVLVACEGKIGAILDRIGAMAPGERVTRDALHAMIGAPRTVKGEDGKADTITTDRFDLVKATIGAVTFAAPGMLVDLDKGRNAGLYLGHVPEVSEEEKKAKTETSRKQAKDLLSKGKAFDSVNAERDKLAAELAALRAQLAATGS